MLKPLYYVSALVLFGIAATTNAGPLPQEKSEPAAPGQANSSVKLSEKAEARTKALYSQECALCHGDTGNGKTDVAVGMKLTLDDWTDPKTLAGKSDKDLFGVIRNGKGQMTPEPVGRAKDEEVRNLILYIRGLAKQAPATAPDAAPAAAPVAVPPATN
ncbi:MAG: cytochrome c [Terracidiphilus sp.]|jgi:mono/diheme cytochrome c family protein